MFTESKIDRSKFESIIVFNVENDENKNIKKKIRTYETRMKFRMNIYIHFVA